MRGRQQSLKKYAHFLSKLLILNYLPVFRSDTDLYFSQKNQNIFEVIKTDKIIVLLNRFLIYKFDKI